MNEYQTILNKEYQGRLWAFFFIILFAIFMVVFTVIIVRRIFDKKERIITCIVFIFLIFGLIFLSAAPITQAVAIKKDIDDNSFITYYGKYELRLKRNTNYCYIYDGENYIRLLDLTYGMTDEYEGYVVYGKNSLYVVDIYE